MNAPAFILPSPQDVSDAARTLGKRGGRPRGSFSSPLSIWLHAEAQQRQREGYRCREAFRILRESEEPDGRDAFVVTDWTADQHGLDIETRVTWDYFKKVWKKLGDGKGFLSP